MKHRVKEVIYRIYRVPEFREWFDEQTEKGRVQIDDRLSKVQDEAHFGEYRSVSEDGSVLEFKWKNGRRVYFAHIPEKKILVLLGGNKNGQDKDIHRAKKLFEKYTE